MPSYPVHYRVEHPELFTRLQLGIRLLAFLTLAAISLSFASVYLFAYLALPVYAAIRLSTVEGTLQYTRSDRSRILQVLHWFAALSAWAGLVADRIPIRDPEETVTFIVEGPAQPTASLALARVITGLPSALVLALLAWFGAFVWIWAALSVLVSQRIGNRSFQYLVGLQRWGFRLLAYQASLVDAYPPFSFADVLPPIQSAHRGSAGLREDASLGP